MVADLVNEHMGDKMAQLLLTGCPFIQDRATVEKDHVRVARHIQDALLVEAHTLVKPGQVVGIFDVQFIENVVRRKVFDADQQTWQTLPEELRDDFESVARIARLLALQGERSAVEP